MLWKLKECPFLSVNYSCVIMIRKQLKFLLHGTKCTYIDCTISKHLAETLTY